MDLRTPECEAVRNLEPDLVDRTPKFIDLSAATDINPVKKVFLSAAKQERSLTFNTKEITQSPHNDFNGDSDCDFPELPPFKEFPFLPQTPREKLRSTSTRPVFRLPPTPNTTPARRLRFQARPLDSPSRARPFKKAVQKSIPRSSLTFRTPRFSIFHEISRTSAHSISALEFERVAEAVLGQVDWKAVSEHVASNRPEGVFKRVIAGLLAEKADLLKKAEKDMEQSTEVAEHGN